MCRGGNLGTCVAEGCETPIRCQDTGGFCDDHDPYDFTYCECDGVCTCPPPTPRPQVNEAKRLRYDIQQLERYIPTAEVALAKKREDLVTATGRLSVLRDRLSACATSQETARSEAVNHAK